MAYYPKLQEIHMWNARALWWTTNNGIFNLMKECGNRFWLVGSGNGN